MHDRRLHDPDTRFDATLVKQLRHFLDSHPQFEIVGPSVFNMFGTFSMTFLVAAWAMIARTRRRFTTREAVAPPVDGRIITFLSI